MERINITDLILDKVEPNDVVIVRDYVPFSEKMNIGRSVADTCFENGDFDLAKYLMVGTCTLIVSYTNIDIIGSDYEVYDYICQHPELLEILPADSDMYRDILELCLDERVKNDSMEKAIKDNVGRISSNLNGLIRSVTKAINNVDVEKTGNRIGMILQTVADKLPDLKNEKNLVFMTDFIKDLKGK